MSIYYHFCILLALEPDVSVGVLRELMILNDGVNWIMIVLGSMVRISWQDEVIHVNELPVALPLCFSSCLCSLPPPAMN